MPAEVRISLAKACFVSSWKYCWGNLVAYRDEAAMPTFSTAVSYVDRSRSQQWGQMWHIVERPACVAVLNDKWCVLALSSKIPVPARIDIQDVAALARWFEQQGALRSNLARSAWSSCSPPFHSWSSSSSGGSVPLAWRQSRCETERPPFVEAWEAWLETLGRRPTPGGSGVLPIVLLTGRSLE